jgi:hypothetical protein
MLIVIAQTASVVDAAQLGSWLNVLGVVLGIVLAALYIYRFLSPRPAEWKSTST